MAVFVFSHWCFLGVVFFYKGDFGAWHGSCVGRKWKKAWGATPLCLFWTIWKERNTKSFENEELSILRLKNLFSWSRMYIAVGPMPLCDFIDWLSPH